MNNKLFFLFPVCWKFQTLKLNFVLDLTVFDNYKSTTLTTIRGYTITQSETILQKVYATGKLTGKGGRESSINIYARNQILYVKFVFE